MPVWPDIVVTNPDSDEVFLAVQVKAGGAGAHLAEWQIKDYMVHQSCPIGMLVTPEDSLFFSESLHGYEPETIQNIGECRTSDLLDAGSLADPYLVRRVE
jgi:hypothetical protein